MTGNSDDTRKSSSQKMELLQHGFRNMYSWLFFIYVSSDFMTHGSGLNLAMWLHTLMNRPKHYLLLHRNPDRSIFLRVDRWAEKCVMAKIKLHYYLRHSWPVNSELLPTLTIKPHSGNVSLEDDKLWTEINFSLLFLPIFCTSCSFCRFYRQSKVYQTLYVSLYAVRLK